MGVVATNGDAFACLKCGEAIAAPCLSAFEVQRKVWQGVEDPWFLWVVWTVFDLNQMKLGRMAAAGESHRDGVAICFWVASA